MRLRLGALPSPLTATASAAPYVIASTLILGFVIVGLFLRPPNQPPPLTQPILIVTPLTLDFDMLKVGQKAVRSVIIKTNSDSQLRWKIVSGNAQWLSITQSNETKESNNLREVNYDITANTSKLHEGKYSVTYNIDAGRVKDQQIQIKIRVIPPSSQPSSAKLNVNPLTLDFGTQNMGSQMTQLLTVSNSGQMDLNWRADRGNATWFTLDTSRGKIPPGGQPQVIKVNVDTTNLMPGQYSAKINFASNGGNTSARIKLIVASTPPGQGSIVSSISPASGPASGGTTVTIKGSGFTGATGVSFGSTAATIVSRDSDTQITAISPAGSGTVHVTVTTPGGNSATSAADLFSYNAPPPSVTSISPTSGPARGGTSVTIAGSGFTCATNVSFGATTAQSFTIKSDTHITAVSPAGSGTVDVTVTTPGGTASTNPNYQFTYLSLPVVKYIMPTSGPVAGGTSVDIFGSNFTSDSSVSFGSVVARSITVKSGSQITAVSPAGSGTVDVTITTPEGTSVTNNDDQFTYLPSPTVTGISHTSGTNAGGTSVTIKGTGFTNVTKVSFDSLTASSFTVDSDTQITVVSPAGGSCTVDVTVTTPGGTSANSVADQFYITPCIG